MTVLALCIGCNNGFQYDPIHDDVYVADAGGILRLMCPACTRAERAKGRRQTGSRRRAGAPRGGQLSIDF